MKIQQRKQYTIFELLLCRILAWGAAGFDISRELNDARVLAQLLKGGVR